MNRTPAYWPTRVLLAVGLFASALCVALATSYGFLMGGTMFGDDGEVLGVPRRVVVAVVAIALALFGLVWMLRIFRGPRDEPSAWRYRR